MAFFHSPATGLRRSPVHPPTDPDGIRVRQPRFDFTSKGVFMKNITKKSFLFAAAALFLSPAFANAERPSREEVQANRESFFMAADEDESGGLTSEELEVFRSLAEASRAERKFVRADMNEDGELSLEELGKMDRKKHRSKRFR
ncbi:MAG TPA: hypothetical protein DCG06_11020 [Deltaproteobacteria bacterium]|nr:hypothetical protein [Deltaproteobacteria bacterium]